MTAFPLSFNAGAAYFIDGDVNPTPTQIRILQSMSIDLKATIKKLYGQNLLPVATGRSQIDVSGKAKFADYQPRFMRDFFGSTMAVGQTTVYPNEPHTPASTTQAVTNATGGITDLGVAYASTGLPLVRVASAPSVGQYSVVPSTGTYTVNVADEVPLLFSYANASATGGDTITLQNASAGAASSFKTVLSSSYQGIQTNIILNACIPESLKLLDNKLGDFSMPEFDFSCVTDASDVLGIISIPVQS